MMRNKVLLYLFLITWTTTNGRSIDSSHHGNQHVSNRQRRSNTLSENTLMYLMTFGYLPQSDLETGNLRTDDQVKEAIRSMQSFAGIPVTGQVDDATKQLMRTPRCGLPDIMSDEYRSKRNADFATLNSTVPHGNRIRHENKRRSKRYTVQGQKWTTTNLTYSVRPPYTNQIEVGMVRYQVQRALELWSKVSRLNFREIDSDSADIKISFHTKYHNDGYPFDGKGTLLAHAFFPGSGIGGDAHFDDEEHWLAYVDGEGSGLSFYAVAAHEFGHSLGLSHSSVQGAIMYPYYQNIKNDYTLSDDDVRGIQYLYGARDRPDQLPTNPTPPRVSPTKKPFYPTKPSVIPTKTPAVTKRPTTRPPGFAVPDACDTSYDAISIFRNELFVFKDRYFWRIGDSGSGRKLLTPTEIDRFWYGLPENLTHIDAVYERPSAKREIVIFIGRQYWIYSDNRNHQGPLPLTRLGLPPELDKIDGAMVWGHNGKTYFFSGTMYWRFDEEAQKVELDYPRDMSMWKGIPYNIDSVFQWKDSKTYFFKGKVFWKFNNRRMRVESTTPSLISPFWMGCPSNQIEFSENLDAEGRIDYSSATLIPQAHYQLLFVLLFLRAFFD